MAFEMDAAPSAERAPHRGSTERAPHRGWDLAMAAASALGPALVAASGARAVAPASHDVAVVRAVGFGWTGLFGALDAIASAPFLLVPVGTRALRASLACALLCGVAGFVAYQVTRRIVEAASREASPRLTSAVSAALTLTALVGPAWQTEASAPGGAVTGALLVLATLALALRARGASLPALGLLLGLSLSEGPLVALASLAAAAPALAPALGFGAPEGLAPTRRELARALASFALGLAPLGLAALFARRAPGLAVAWSPFASALPAGSSAVSLSAAAKHEVGLVLLAAGFAGAAIAAFASRARRPLASLAGVALVGALAVALGAPAGPHRFSSPALAAIAATCALAAVAFASAVVAIARARVPFAQASAALVVVLELALPARAADESLGRRERRVPRAAAVWNEVAWGPLPPASVLLVGDLGTLRRVAAARATGQMRGDVLVVPSFDLAARAARRALAVEPKLTPIFRDVALGVAPEELSLAEVAQARPLVAVFDPRWDRDLARHLVPIGLSSRYEPGPRGSSDRRRALDAFSAGKERLARVASAEHDPDLAAATARLLRARAIGAAACGERDVLARALDDLRPFAPDDPVARTLVRRIVTTKGRIDVSDLAP